jgi:hypothetical protein
MRLALLVFEIQSSFPVHNIIDHILVHGILLLRKPADRRAS